MNIWDEFKLWFTSWLRKRTHLRLIADDDLNELFVIPGTNAVPTTINKYRSIQNPHPDVSLAAVKKNWLCIAYVKDQTDRVCWVALEQDRRALAYIKKPTQEMIEYCE